ncbi:MAG: diadenylate cyclase CdaA [Clostridia bacterium]|nr:diadenylate cyclase CdaA [Clostridia bacterium]
MSFRDEFTSLFQQILGVIGSFRIADFLDICLVAFVVFSVVKFIRETRAIQLFKGILLFCVVYAVISALDMQATSFLFRSVASNAVVFLIIIFTPEIRHALESVGRSGFSNFSVFNIGKSSRQLMNEKLNTMITEICRSVAKMSEDKIGALIVFERQTLLGSVIETGTTVDALATEELIGTVFFPKTPLHDGAAVIRADRVAAAGCILPLTKNNALSKELGTRHRAAIGMSEESDAVVVVVSEETGIISIVSKGKIQRGLTSAQLRDSLQNYLIVGEDQKKKGLVAKMVSRFSKNK